MESEKSKKSCERWKCRTRGQNVRNDCKTEMPYAQRHSKVSEWGKPANAGVKSGKREKREKL
ncbi:MAG: hypothetical protein WCV67_00145 [Victivallaceae bacterium]